MTTAQHAKKGAHSSADRLPTTPSWCFRTASGAHILPDKLHMLNVAFLVPQMRREFGGCAGNIAYNLKLLGDDGLSDGRHRSRLPALLASG